MDYLRSGMISDLPQMMSKKRDTQNVSTEADSQLHYWASKSCLLFPWLHTVTQLIRAHRSQGPTIQLPQNLMCLAAHVPPPHSRTEGDQHTNYIVHKISHHKIWESTSP